MKSSIWVERLPSGSVHVTVTNLDEDGKPVASSINLPARVAALMLSEMHDPAFSSFAWSNAPAKEEKAA